MYEINKKTRTMRIYKSVYVCADNATTLARYFRDPEMLKTLLVDDFNFSRDAAEALGASQANLASVLVTLSLGCSHVFVYLC